MAVGAEVVLAAPVVGDDVPGPRVLGAHDLEAVLALLGAAHPGLDRGPAAARHLVPGLLQRPGDERRAPRVARARPSPRRGTARPAGRGSRRRSRTPAASWRRQRRATERAPAPAARSDARPPRPPPAGAGAAAGRGAEQALGLRELRPGSGRGTARRGARCRRSTRRRSSGRRSACPPRPARLDLLGLVEEPLDLQLGLLRIAGVGALVPDPDAHLEEPDRVGVAEVEVLHARLDQRRHQRQLGRQAALLAPGRPSRRRSARSARCRPGRRRARPR